MLFYDASVKRIIQLMIPRMIGLAGNQIAVVVVTILASTLSAGSLTIFNYANNLQGIPVGIFGISLAVAAFPYFSQSLSENDASAFRKIFSLQFRRILYFLIPISFTLLLLRAQIVRVVLGTGAFDWEATRLTAQALGFFSLSICAQGLIPLLARSFYALEDTVTPVVVSFIDIAATIILSLVLLPHFGILGLVFADSIGAIGNMLVLFILLHRRFGDLHDSELAQSVMRISALSLVAAAIMYLMLQLTAPLLDTHTFVGIFTQGLLSGSVGIAVYVLLSILLGFDEVRVVKRYLLKFIRPLVTETK
jgi:putative peptidoglycan lipid II flippase